jgi:hypothetical protein
VHCGSRVRPAALMLRSEMTSLPRSIQLARWAEALYALTALFFVSGLPDPSSRSALAWVHWLGTAILAGLLWWRLRRPDRTILAVAAIVSIYVLANAIWALPRLAGVLRNSAGTISAAAILVTSIIWATQLTVLVVALRARRSSDRPGSH